LLLQQVASFQTYAMNAELTTSLVSEIVGHFNASIEARDAAVDSMKRALIEAVACGHYLIKAKEQTGHGSWMRWFHENIASNYALVRNFSHDTASKYMALASLPPEVLATLHGKKEGYIALDMWYKEGCLHHINRDPQGTNWVSVLSALTIKIERLFDTRPINGWDEQERLVFVERARPIVKRFLEAGGSV
jgi:hypothetical protein